MTIGYIYICVLEHRSHWELSNNHTKINLEFILARKMKIKQKEHIFLLLLWSKISFV